FIYIDTRAIGVAPDGDPTLIYDHGRPLATFNLECSFADSARGGSAIRDRRGSGRLWWSRRHRRDLSFFDRDIILAGGQPNQRTALADGAVIALPAAVVVSLLLKAEVGFKIAMRGLGRKVEVVLFGQSEIDGAVAILDCDVAEGGGSREL